MSSTVKTRILCVSDTHSGRRDALFSKDGAFRPPFPKADILIHSGDLSMTGKPHEYLEALDMLSQFDAELKLVIAGNHDLSLHESFYLSGSKPGGSEYFGYQFDEDAPFVAKQLWTGPKAKAAGVTYLEEGMHHFTLPSNGASFSVYASPWQPEFYDWAFNYPHREDRFNPEGIIGTASKDPKTGDIIILAPPERDPHPIPEGELVDIMITHGPPWKHLDLCKSGDRAGCPHLLRALERVRPRLHCFGHIHEAWGCERVKWGDGPIEAREEQTITIGQAINATASVLTPFDPTVIQRRAAYTDLSRSSNAPLQAQLETLVVNSCIVDLDYQAEYCGWLVDIELPTARP